ncbi:hypothetical protein QAD02_001966 [Eretmocerus hayati]|uniref:Uncharacterized protein n=1 Tax=Eretmocerus hayati TaxID=131215 RepID=A0ACC2NKE9_9HYME|nr:hypothetical protein QAD02_001966 [Eretmocerus hayati]
MCSYSGAEALTSGTFTLWGIYAPQWCRFAAHCGPLLHQQRVAHADAISWCDLVPQVFQCTYSPVASELISKHNISAAMGPEEESHAVSVFFVDSDEPNLHICRLW